MSRVLNTPIVIENKPGAGGGIGMAYVAKAKSDGYTLLLALSSISILPEADRVTGRAPMFQFAQLVPIARLTADPTVLAVRADSPWKTLQDFVADARKRPGGITYGSSGNYGTMHVPMEMLKAKAGIRVVHIPYTGAGPAVVALLGGQVDAIASGPSTVAQQIKAGKLRALAHWGDKPLESMPGLPSLKQAGYDASFAQWSALFVPAGTPPEVVQKLRAAAATVATDPTVVATINRAGSPIEYLDAPEFQTYWDTDARGMTAAVRAIGKVD
ncbi:MAG: tripartite tricarboxylate transporter substrate binding protein, partial [Pseudomonadota bacterium]|nr:tripartite tricarboxylate transporter substrate binding protein [Pseudomonadota bacterium]